MADDPLPSLPGNAPLTTDTLRRLLEALPDALVIYHEDRIVLVNSRTEDLFGYPREELLGRPLELLVPERFRTRNFPLGKSVVLSGRRKDGHEFPVEVSLGSLQTEGGLLVVGIIRDISELEKFAGTAAHDLLAPLRTIRSFIKELEEDCPRQPGATASSWIAHIDRTAERMQRLIENLLAYAHARTEEKTPDPAALTDALKAACANLQAQIDDTRASVTWDDELPTVLVQPAHLLRLFQNLIDNALKFRGEDRQPLIHVSARRQDDFWEISIADNGIGMEPRDLEKIFVPTGRLSSTEKYPGSGMGLTICQTIVQRHGGRIRAASPGLNRGSTFSFTLPALPPGVSS
jgi:PAS domain S-box-containing protein